MDNLPQKISNLSNLTLEENQLMIAKTATKFVDLSNEMKAGKCIDLVTDAVERSGTKQPDPKIMQRAIKDLAEAFETNLKHSTPEEIALALKIGQQNHPDQFSISSRVIFQWIKEFREGKKLELNKSIRIKAARVTEEKRPDPTPEEMIKLIEAQFDLFVKTNDVYAFTYENLGKLGVSFTNEEKFEEIRKAKPKLIQETYEGATPMIMFQVKARVKELQSSTEKKPCAAIISEAQKQLVSKFFNQCMEELISPTEMIEKLKIENKNT